MTRKRTLRRPITPLPPRGLRPKLKPDQLTDLALAHIVNLDLITHGKADEEVLWQMVGGIFTWSRVAQLLQVGVDEMAAQLELATRVVERFGRTGRIGFSGTEYQVAKLGVAVMDELAAIVDQPTASAAADWSETKVNLLASRRQLQAA
jgi:hypothetical protein